MKKFLSLLIAVTMFASLASACGEVKPSTSTASASGGTSSATGTAEGDVSTKGMVKVDAFVIGCVNHMTGQTALTGELRKSGSDLAVKEINAAGGIDGLPIKIVYEDDQGTNTGAVAATQKIMSAQEAVAFMIERSTMVQAVDPIIKENEIPTTSGATADSINDLDNPWFFRMRVADGGVATVFAKYLVDTLGCKKIAALYCADTFGEGGNTGTKAALKELYDITPVTEQSYTAGTKDYTAQLLAIKSAGVDAIYAWGTNGEDNAIILRQFKELGLDQSMKFIGSAAYGSSVTLDLALDNADGIYSVYDFAVSDTRPEFQSWYKAYKAEYPDTEPDFWCITTYDQVKLIADAAVRAGLVKKVGNDYYIPEMKEARTKLADALRATDHLKAAMGELYADENQNMIHNMAIVQIEGGKLKLIENITLD